MAGWFYPELAVTLAAGLFMVGLAALLLVRDAGNAVHRSFALYLVLRGLLNINNYWADGAKVSWASFVAPMFFLAVPWATLDFLGKYLARYGGLAWPRWAPWAILAVAAGMVGAYLAWPSMYQYQANRGALFWSYGLVFGAYAFVSVMLIRCAIRIPPGRRRTSMQLAALAFALDPAFIATSVLPVMWGSALGLMPVAGSVGPPTPDLLLASIPILIGAVFLVGYARRAVRLPDGQGQVALVAMAALAGIVTAVAHALQAPWAEGELLFFDGLWTFAMPALVTFAILRHNLLDSDAKARKGFQSGTMFSIAAGVGVVIAQVMQNLLSNQLGAILGGVLAGGVVLAITPIQRLADRVATVAVPQTPAINDLGPKQRREVYREQAIIAWSDGSIGKKERVLLSHLRDRLGLGHAEAEKIEMQVAQSA